MKNQEHPEEETGKGDGGASSNALLVPPQATQGAQTKPSDKEKEKEKETWQQALKRLTYLIVNHIKLDLFTILLLGFAVPSTKMEVLKYNYR